MSEKNVLIVTYYWPPASAGGVWRFLKMSKYLPEYGWNPIILTVREGAFSAYDDTLLKELPDDIKVVRTKSIDPYRLYNLIQGKQGKQIPEAMSGVVESSSFFSKLSAFIRGNFFIPDPKVGWIPYAVRAGKRILKNHNISVIVSTGPPQTAHLIGRRLSKYSRIPWVMDFRDPWTSNYMVTELFTRSKIADWIDRRLENKSVVQASCITGVSPGIISEFESRHESCHTVYNGFDEDDFPIYERSKSTHFTLSYIGSMKPNQNVKDLWKAIHELNEEYPDFKHDFRLEFIGNLNKPIIEFIKSFGIDKQLILSGFLSHAEALQRMQSTSMLLFIVPNARYAEKITSGKIFEYLASKTPLMSIGPVQGNAAIVLEKAKREKIMDYEDRQAFKAYLLEKYSLWKKNEGVLPRISGNDHLQFSRKQLAGQYAEILDNLINNNS